MVEAKNKDLQRKCHQLQYEVREIRCEKLKGEISTKKRELKHSFKRKRSASQEGSRQKPKLTSPQEAPHPTNPPKPRSTADLRIIQTLKRQIQALTTENQQLLVFKLKCEKLKLDNKAAEAYHAKIKEKLRQLQNVNAKLEKVLELKDLENKRI